MVKKLGLGLVIMALLALAWTRIPQVQSATQKQEDLIEKASGFIDDKAYVTAIELLEQAITYRTDKSVEAEEMLKMAYLAAGDYDRSYTALLAKQMSAINAPAQVFREAADYYLEREKLGDALSVLKDGVKKTGDSELIRLYEQERYVYTEAKTTFEYVTDFYGGYIQVQRGGLWGIANRFGKPLLPCEYEKVSTFSDGRAIVMLDGEIYAVNNMNKRTALLKGENAVDFGNPAQNRLAIKLANGSWKRATPDFAFGTTEFDEIGTYSEGYAAVKQNGKWGVINIAGDYFIRAEHDEIILDSLGRCYGQKAVFLKDGGIVSLYVDGKKIENISFDDAHPFNADGYAAIKQNGKWGFVNTSGEIVIEPSYEQALSFNGHLAAVEQDGLWGYLAKTGSFGIEPQFLDARSFSEGNAPVLTESGWVIISLVEFAKGVGLL